MAPANVAGLTGTLFNIAGFCGYGAAVVVGDPIIERPLFCALLPALAPTHSHLPALPAPAGPQARLP